ncbi:class I SAM-dependent methyltransferase [Acetivibrio cellulolyticus]|uniref:class I SAM-dependent methyltransferase n=1 Tax=Acetivibrio cellulolyticus TaxID=35830 RepID=UPI0001E2C22F|nr:class I SAM-dependent methyltransferase [Acetivibrio cellulolyticus]
MNDNNMFESNRAAWNEALEYHQKARNNSLKIGFNDSNFTVFNGEYDNIVINKLNQIDLSGKTISQMQCNNGRELLSLMKLGAKEAIGFDISDTAISEAKQLAEIAKLNVKFIRSNILEIDDQYNDCFDFIYISEGSLQWFPDLNDYFSVLSRLLKKDGQIFISEIHPFFYIFGNGFDFKKQNFDSITSYFKKGPYNYSTGIDYVGGVKYESSECFWFMHKISDIINAIIQTGIEIQEFDEYTLGNSDNETSKLLNNAFPRSYILIGKKK